MIDKHGSVLDMRYQSVYQIQTSILFCNYTTLPAGGTKYPVRDVWKIEQILFTKINREQTVILEGMNWQENKLFRRAVTSGGI